MKPPDDPVPSGDRTMARQLVKAMEFAGHEVKLVSRLKCRVRSPDVLHSLRTDAAREVERIAGDWTAGCVPDLIVTYHVYYKSPDLVGAALASRFKIPYVTIEASYAGKRDHDDWAAAQAVSSAAIRLAALNVCFTERDTQGVRQLVSPARVTLLPPFADFSGVVRERNPEDAGGPVELLAVAMMLKGNKLESFRLLAEAIRHLRSSNWQLTIVGDGPKREEVEAIFSGLGRVRFAGQMDGAGVAGYLAESDVFAWPGYREAFGLAYLEAQGAGLPVVAMNSGGVEAVVKDGETGVLTPEGDAKKFAAALDELIDDWQRRVAMGRRARVFARQERGLASASAQLGEMLQGVVDE